MPRTTVDLDASVLRELKRLQKRERKSLGSLISELLAVALRQRSAPHKLTAPGLEWTAKPMHPRVDLEDKEALRKALEEP